MHSNNEKFEPRIKNDFFLIISIIALILVTAAIIWIALTRYYQQIEDISLNENRFLTTEWRLLQVLKAQTDQMLRQKDHEIEKLNQRYLMLSRGNASSRELEQIESQLQQAKNEREEILTQRRDPVSETFPESNKWLTELLRPENLSAVNLLLQQQLEENQLHIEALEKELENLRDKQEELNRESENTMQNSLARLKKLSAKITGLSEATQAALTDLKQKAQEIDNQKEPSYEDLTTRALIRAIVSSPAVRNEYPELLKSLDRYFENYGLQAQLKGRREAYLTTSASLELILRQLQSP